MAKTKLSEFIAKLAYDVKLREAARNLGSESAFAKFAEENELDFSWLELKARCEKTHELSEEELDHVTGGMPRAAVERPKIY